MKLYTVILGFGDHRQGLGQYQAESPLEALHSFVKTNESIEHFDREKLLAAIAKDPFIQLKNFKGLWSVIFSPTKLLEITGPDNDYVLGGFVIQSDPNAPKEGESQ